MISFGERCYPNQYDEISDDEISGFANTMKFLTTKFPPPLCPTITVTSFSHFSLRPMYAKVHFLAVCSLCQ